jgi:hypothetical protein
MKQKKRPPENIMKTSENFCDLPKIVRDELYLEEEDFTEIVFHHRFVIMMKSGEKQVVVYDTGKGWRFE